MFPPERIVCLTEETVETLYLLGEERRIAGVSGYAVRPPRVRREKPRVSAFISADVPKILALHPDLVLTFSDLQADIALVERMDGDAEADQLGGDVGLQVGKRQDQIGLQREDFRHVGADEGRHPRLLAPHPRRAHRVARNAGDAALLAEEIERLHGFFR